MQHSQLSGSPLTSLPQGHELAQLLMQCRAIVLQSMNREDVAVSFAQKLYAPLPRIPKPGTRIPNPKPQTEAVRAPDMLIPLTLITVL